MDNSVSLWGKIGGASLGFAMGGPLGRAHRRPGRSLRHGQRRRTVRPRHGDRVHHRPDRPVRQDGQGRRRRHQGRDSGVPQIVEVPDAEADGVQSLFDLAKQTSAGFEAYARQIAGQFSGKRELLEDVLDGLFHIAKADGAVHEAERRYVARVARSSASATLIMRASRRATSSTRPTPRSCSAHRETGTTTGSSAISAGSSPTTIPDRQIALGLPAEAVRIASDRLATINAAWDRVARQRGIR